MVPGCLRSALVLYLEAGSGTCAVCGNMPLLEYRVWVFYRLAGTSCKLPPVNRYGTKGSVSYPKEVGRRHNSGVLNIAFIVHARVQMTKGIGVEDGEGKSKCWRRSENAR